MLLVFKWSYGSLWTWGWFYRDSEWGKIKNAVVAQKSHHVFAQQDNKDYVHNQTFNV